MIKITVRRCFKIAESTMRTIKEKKKLLIIVLFTRRVTVRVPRGGQRAKREANDKTIRSVATLSIAGGRRTCSPKMSYNYGDRDNKNNEKKNGKPQNKKY